MKQVKGVETGAAQDATEGGRVEEAPKRTEREREDIVSVGRLGDAYLLVDGWMDGEESTGLAVVYVLRTRVVVERNGKWASVRWK